MDSCTTSYGSCFTVTWHIFINHFLEVGPTQHHKTTTLQTVTTVDLTSFGFLDSTMCEDPAWIETHWNSNRLRARSGHTPHSRLRDHTYMSLGGVLGWPLDTFFWALNIFHGHGSWLMCEVALNFSEVRNPTACCMWESQDIVRRYLLREQSNFACNIIIMMMRRRRRRSGRYLCSTKLLLRQPQVHYFLLYVLCTFSKEIQCTQAKFWALNRFCCPHAFSTIAAAPFALFAFTKLA